MSLVEQFHLDARCVVLVISAGRIPVAAQVAVLRAGADDVWDGFPPDTALGIARFVALRRRTIAEEVLRYRKLNIYPEAREVIVGGNESVRLTPAEFRLLHTLALHHERVLTFDHLMDTVWEETTTSRSALRKLVQRLRKKLGRHAGVSIESQTGVGYRLMPAGDETLSRPTMLHS
ncbi:MAG: winged helix-turn-helix domain-containing protein [Thermomicrobiales bacterium]